MTESGYLLPDGSPIDLGTPVTISREFYRSSESRPSAALNGRSELWKVWKTRKPSNGVDGIVVGVRTLSNGPVDYWGEDGTTYTAREHLRAALVSVGLQFRPVLVPFEAVTLR